MKKLAMPVISEERLAAISIPVALIWGRYDKALKLHIAQSAAKKYNWPLSVIDDSRDDPKIERPVEFTAALFKALNGINSEKKKNAV